MTQRVKAWNILLCFAVFAGGLAQSPAAGPTPAPVSAAGAQAAVQALDLLNSGRLQEAEDAYTALLALYPNAEVAPEALFRLGYIQYMRAEYPQALATLNRVASPPAIPEIKTAADALIPEVMAAAAAAMAPSDPNRKQSFDNAIQQFDAFVQRYPESQKVESALYGRAMAAYQSQDYEGAEHSLRENMQRFPNSDSILDSVDLLAVVLTAQAANIMKTHGEEESAYAKYTEALGYLADLVKQRTDVGLANDAQFQIGEVYFNRGSVEEGSRKPADLTQAIAAYRAVQPQAVIVAGQQALVAETLAAVRQVAAAGNRAALEEVQRRQDRANAKLAAAQQEPDQTFAAQLRIAASYFLLQKYDESRVLLRYLQPLVDLPEQKTQILYYMVLTYAGQGLMDKAGEAYNDFETLFRAAPLGENLPLVMGAAYMSGSNSQPDKAVSYLQQERALYPDSPLVNEALDQQAAALVRQQKFDDAIATYQQFLASGPPADQAAGAEEGIGAIYQQTGKLTDAMKQYGKVAADYPDTPMAEQCSFYAAALETSMDLKTGRAQLQAFLAKYPKGKFAPQAMMAIGAVQSAQGDAAGANQTYADVISKFPNSDSAPKAYLQQASILAKAGKTDAMIALLRNFIAAYPDSDELFYAYDTIAQNQLSNDQPEEAAATYHEMAEAHPDNPMAPTALCRVAELWRQNAAAEGRYASMNEQERAAWSKNVTGSITAVESLLKRYPNSDQMGLALHTLLSDQEMLLGAQLKKRVEIEQYFNDLSEKASANSSAQKRIQFTLGIFAYKREPGSGMPTMNANYDLSLVYAPADLDFYGEALMAEGRFDDAYKVYQKIAADYPIPPDAAAAQAPAAIQEAQATALFGMATALQKQGRRDEAAKLLAALNANYTWSPKVIEAKFATARTLMDQNKLDDASKVLAFIVRSRIATAVLRARAFLLMGDIDAQKGNTAAAIDSYLKTAVFYAGVEDAAAEGLWRGGQMLEQQAKMLTEDSTPKRSQQMGKAEAAYKGIVTKYPDSRYVPQAQDRLRALGA